MEWTEVIIEINADDIDVATDIANMVVPYGVYIEDYRTLEEETWEIANIDLAIAYVEAEVLAVDYAVARAPIPCVVICPNTPAPVKSRKVGV